MRKLAIFASGTGTNAEAIMTFFEQNPTNGMVAAIISNNNNAPVLKKAKNHNVPAFVFNKDAFYSNPEKILNQLQKLQIDWIVLAGFMLLLNNEIVQKYDGKIINVHPALLPKFGGKGMYGMHVHQAVVMAKEAESGITIHFVNDKFDDGKIIFQAITKISEHDTAEDVAAKIHTLEQKYFPKIISETINK